MELSVQSAGVDVGGGESIDLSRLSRADLTVHLALHPEKRELARHLGLSTCTVASYSVNPLGLKLHDTTMPRGTLDEDLNTAYDYAHISAVPLWLITDYHQSKKYAFSVFAAIVRERIVDRVDIDVSNCSPLVLRAFAETLYLACGSDAARGLLDAVNFTCRIPCTFELDDQHWAWTLGKVLRVPPTFLYLPADKRSLMSVAWSGDALAENKSDYMLDYEKALIEEWFSSTLRGSLIFNTEIPMRMDNVPGFTHSLFDYLRQHAEKIVVPTRLDPWHYSSWQFILTRSDGRRALCSVRIASSFGVSCWEMGTRRTLQDEADGWSEHDEAAFCELFDHPSSPGSMSSETCSEFEVVKSGDGDRDEEDTMSLVSAPTGDGEVQEVEATSEEGIVKADEVVTEEMRAVETVTQPGELNLDYQKKEEEGAGTDADIVSRSMCASVDFEVVTRDTISTPTGDGEGQEVEATSEEDGENAPEMKKDETADRPSGEEEETVKNEKSGPNESGEKGGGKAAAAGFNPYELCFFADLSNENHAAVTSLGRTEKNVVIYAIHSQHVWMGKRPAEWCDRAQTDVFQVGSHLSDEQAKAEFAFSIFTRLLASPSVRCVEIDIRKCSVDMVEHFAEVLSLALPSPLPTLPILILKEEEGERVVKCNGEEAARWRDAIRKIGQALPCRELHVMLECECGKCTFIGNTIYAHWEGVSVLEIISGHVRTKFDWWDGRFPLLRSFADHSVCEGEEAERQLNMLAVAQSNLEKWLSSGHPFFFALRAAVSFTLLREDPRFARFQTFLQPYQTETRVRGDWRGVSHSRDYRLPHSDVCLSATLSIQPSLFSIEVFPSDMDAQRRRVVWI